MPLTLTIRNADSLENGSPLSLILDRRGATIGRAATTDWCLPDPSLHISSRHAEIKFRDGAYVIEDISTNGTFLANSDARLPGPHTINQGDTFVIGRFEVSAALDDATASSMAERNAAPPPPQWKGWGDGAGSSSAPPASASGWGATPSGSAISGTGPMSQNWAPPTAEATPATPQSPSPPPASSGWGAPSANAPDPAPVASTWQSAPAPPAPASAYSSPISATPAPPSADDVWGKIAASNVVDWARGGFGTPAPAPVLAAAPAVPTDSLGVSAAPRAEPAQPVAAAPAAVQPPAAARGDGLDKLLAAAGIERTGLKQGDDETLHQAGQLLRGLIAGLVVMMEARARAKSQMGAAGTSLEFDGNNPLKFARAPEQALLQMLNPPERGFMPTDRAIEDSFRDLQAHQMATLKAMQGALRSTLDRFSPTAIRARADQGGLLKKILPGARDAALWASYEREFGGVAQGSDEAFMDIFAKEFRKAYEESSRNK